MVPAIHPSLARSRKGAPSRIRVLAGAASMARDSGRTRSPAARKSLGRRRRPQWSNHFFENLFNFEWELTKSPAGAYQWEAKDAPATIPDAHDPAKKRRPRMLTS